MNFGVTEMGYLNCIEDGVSYSFVSNLHYKIITVFGTNFSDAIGQLAAMTLEWLSICGIHDTGMAVHMSMADYSVIVGNFDVIIKTRSYSPIRYCHQGHFL